MVRQNTKQEDFYFVPSSFVVVRRGRLQIEGIDVAEYRTLNIALIPIESMKRSEAPSHTNPSFKKKAKPDRLREVAVRMPPPQSKNVKISRTNLNDKQLKSLQYLLSAAAYASILETSTTNTSGLREKCYNYYHGYDEDHIGVVKNFLAGNDRFHI